LIPLLENDITTVTAYIGLGSNLGDGPATVRTALQDMAAIDALELTAQSSLYVSVPLDSSGPDYVNAVAQVQTRLSALQLLEQLRTLEQRAGRLRPYRNAPRTLDLDLLMFGSEQVETSELILPHPRMYERAFVLVPLAEIAAHLVSSAQLLAVQGQIVRRIS
jgi:2-amino-4-hydroxy-6-hydroxymethyldihydropteridine diphosphokinase